MEMERAIARGLEARQPRHRSHGGVALPTPNSTNTLSLRIPGTPKTTAHRVSPIAHTRTLALPPLPLRVWLQSGYPPFPLNSSSRGLERRVSMQEEKQAEAPAKEEADTDDRGNAIVYIDDTAMVVDREGADSEGESESEDEGDGEGGVVHARGSRRTSVGFGAVLDGDDDDDDVEAVVDEVNSEKTPECEVVADDRRLNYTNDLSWAWEGKLKGGVYPNSSIVADNSCDEESGNDSSSDCDSSEDDSAHEGKHAQQTGTTLLILPPHQAPTDEDHDHDGGNENEINVDDDEGDEIEVRVKQATEDGDDVDGDIGSRGADNLEVEVESEGGGAAVRAGDHTDEFSGREGIDRNENIDEDEPSDLDAYNGFVHDGACSEGQDAYRNDDETAAEPPAEGDDENIVNNGEGRDGDDRVGDITAPDIDQEEDQDDGDSCSKNCGAEDSNVGETPPKSSSTPNSEDEIHRLRQALEDTGRVEKYPNPMPHQLPRQPRALQDQIDIEVEACMCGNQHGAVELEKNKNGKRGLSDEDEDGSQEEGGVDDLGERQGSENFSVENSPRSHFKRAMTE
ncbi:hypothetical protein GALMADRAFT_147349 [Galerina marginata CBS 339.88]|uniref:Uncharacterized protein n=1 Tax=Galerina marginata (strain CBS 339.88) TaxID=685588 RepID=A0A067S8I6_GALM3|nr:hypothetical protein GALMADRAFT_147349 [Galerina marginata CBS 339.88]